MTIDLTVEDKIIGLPVSTNTISKAIYSTADVINIILKNEKNNMLEGLFDNLSQDEIIKTYNAIREEIQKVNDIMNMLHGDFSKIKLEKRIQYLGSILELLDLKSDTDIFCEIHIDSIPDEDLVSKYINSQFDAEKLVLLKRLYPIEKDYKFNIQRSSDYIGGIPHGEVGISGDGTCDIGIGNFRPGEYENYALLHEYLHIYILEKGMDVYLDTNNSNHRFYFFYLKNLVNDLIIENIILEKFQKKFSWTSSDLGKYTSSSLIRNINLGTFLTLVTRSLSNEMNFVVNPDIRRDYDISEAIPIILKYLGIVREKYGELSELILSELAYKNDINYEKLLNEVHKILTGGELTFEGGKVNFDNEKKVDKFIKMFPDVPKENEDLNQKVISFLGIEQGLTLNEIKKVFRKNIQKLHPDISQGEYDNEKYSETTELYYKWKAVNGL